MLWVEVVTVEDLEVMIQVQVVTQTGPEVVTLVKVVTLGQGWGTSGIIWSDPPWHCRQQHYFNMWRRTVKARTNAHIFFTCIMWRIPFLTSNQTQNTSLVWAKPQMFTASGSTPD